MRINLLSMSCLDEKSYETQFRSKKVSMGQHGRILFQGVKCYGFYCLIVNDFAMINNISSSSSYIENVYDTKDDNDISFL